MIIAGVGDAADDGDGDLFDAVGSVEAVHGADEPGGVAGGQLEIVLTHALFVVGVAVEEHVRDGVLFAALEDRLDAVFIVVVFLVLCADAAGGGVEHNIDLLAQLVKAACNGNVLRFERCLVSAIDEIEVVTHAVRADHIALAQRLQRQRRGEIGDTDQLHILLHRNAVRQPLPDRAIPGNTYFDHLSSSLVQVRM